MRSSGRLSFVLAALLFASGIQARDLGDRGLHKLHFPGDTFSSVQPQAVTLSYFGGPVIASARVVQVLWGTGVDTTVTSNLPTFFADVVNSPYMDWLCEYNTNTTSYGGATSNQTIGRGTWGGQYPITPSVTSSVIDDSQIGNELAAQIAAGHLPAPTLDAGGHVNTVYMFYFPPGKTITQGGSTSCVQFCAYHYTKVINGKSVPYGVIPYIGSGSSCATGCGSGTYLQNVESASSHELIEAVTDAAVGLATTYGPPLAWYDSLTGQGEIGDICNGLTATITVNGRTHTVQKEWSNAAHACIAVASGSVPCAACTSESTAPTVIAPAAAVVTQTLCQ